MSPAGPLTPHILTSSWIGRTTVPVVLYTHEEWRDRHGEWDYQDNYWIVWPDGGVQYAGCYNGLVVEALGGARNVPCHRQPILIERLEDIETKLPVAYLRGGLRQLYTAITRWLEGRYLETAL